MPSRILGLLLIFIFTMTNFAQGQQAELTAENVLTAIKRGRTFLVSQQKPDGSWGSEETTGYQVGVTSLCVLSLIESGLTADDPAVSRGLNWLRAVKEPQPAMTYEISLMIMALAAAREGARDNLRIFTLAQRLEQGMVSAGPETGSWSYFCNGQRIGNPDRSNSQYAVLGLRDAAYYGIPVEEQTWRRIRDHWVISQSADGGWGYSGINNNDSTGSMTVAGISSLSIANSFLNDQPDLNPDGSFACCLPPEENEALEKAYRWMGRNFSVQSNPRGGGWWLYYLYGLERAGRLSGKRFFGTHDWYREGARILLLRQSKRDGSWKGEGSKESEPVIGSSLALLFLSKGLAPVLVNKLKFGPRDPDDQDQVLGGLWNRHPRDIRNLVEHISTLPKWPHLLTWQSVDFDQSVKTGNVSELLQAPILFLSSDEDVSALMSDAHIDLLRQFLIEGGFLFASRNCQSQKFEQSLYRLVERLYPEGEASLLPLSESHPVYRSEYLLDSTAVPLWGVDVGCRTAIIYSPEDLGCLWDKRRAVDPPERRQDTKTALLRALRIGVNVVAYVTGREPPNKLEEQELASQKANTDQLRGVLSLAKLRHTGDWDAAPNALKKLLMTLEESFGIIAGSQPENIPAGDPELYRHTLIYLHGQRNFELTPDEVKNIEQYLRNGGVLFADACCGAPKFDDSFRRIIQQMFPDQSLERIPIEHEIFSGELGQDLSSVTRKVPLNNSGEGPLNPVEQAGPPFLEGIKLGERYAVIYSKYDISCALEKQTSLSCIGYIPEDAAKIATNVVLYSVLQDVTALP